MSSGAAATINPKPLANPKPQAKLASRCIIIITCWPETRAPINMNRLPASITPAIRTLISAPAIVASPVICHAKTEKHNTSSHRAEPDAVPINHRRRNPPCRHISTIFAKSRSSSRCHHAFQFILTGQIYLNRDFCRKTSFRIILDHPSKILSFGKKFLRCLRNSSKLSQN